MRFLREGNHTELVSKITARRLELLLNISARRGVSMSKLSIAWLYSKRLTRHSIDVLKKQRSTKELLAKYFNYRGAIEYTAPITVNGHRFKAIYGAGRLFLLDKKWFHAYSQVIDCSDITDVECANRLFGGQMTFKIGNKKYYLQNSSLQSLKELEVILWNSIKEKSPVNAIVSQLKKFDEERVLRNIIMPRHRHGKFRLD